MRHQLDGLAYVGNEVAQPSASWLLSAPGYASGGPELRQASANNAAGEALLGHIGRAFALAAPTDGYRRHRSSPARSGCLWRQLPKQGSLFPTCRHALGDGGWRLLGLTGSPAHPVGRPTLVLGYLWEAAHRRGSRRARDVLRCEPAALDVLRELLQAAHAWACSLGEGAVAEGGS